MCIYKLIYGVGLEALRNLFMEINPTWSNQPSDAAAFDRGKMKLTKDDEVSFKKGNIHGWDFSLITSILLFSNACSSEMKRRPGHDTALKELKKCRNKVLGHPSTDKMSDAVFNHYWPLLSTHLSTVGADPNAIAEIKLQSGIVSFILPQRHQIFISCVGLKGLCLFIFLFVPFFVERNRSLGTQI